ncbi:TPA: hypothetical protein ACOEPF_000869 [Stenotrophomonas maltophilia]|jgi:hypothetical protein|uniref:hypothetical protein n=1 Tax=Stenotrophomonas TaxID=40323 RepID=UPI0013120A80|nr:MULTISPECIES: hypothetical protein [Stenotrophomonas]ELO6222921.1 hypothetical protein [Escherichia coli]MBN5024126.1 hypothetical protein [Stenotrophomonas maltophilia]MDH1484154.1 hypothetical protein [Stenotrophomonas sp. GD03712]WHL19959.1 hypothetical protein QLF99_05965 [Stenotrophomonas acidaminiphila]WON67189.1 hypothetical protein RWT08_13285 [Stenotrophomonas maltophilia]
MTASPIKPLAPIALRDWRDLALFLVAGLSGWVLLKLCAQTLRDPSAKLPDLAIGLSGIVITYAVISAWVMVPTVLLAGAA